MRARLASSILAQHDIKSTIIADSKLYIIFMYRILRFCS